MSKNTSTAMAAAREPVSTARRPGRPRSAEAGKAILGAALGLLAEVGLQALSIEQVAARAGVGKKTIYRRWPSKDALVCDAIRSMQSQMPVIDTGNLRDDLIAMYRTALGSLAAVPLMRPLYLRLASEFHANPAVFQVFLTQLVLPRFEQFTQSVRNAQARGEIRQDLDLDLVADVLIGPILSRWVFTGMLRPAPTTADTASLAEQIAELLLRCLGSRPQRPDPPT
jgi:AcrR family transcriptional regulator